MCVCAFVPSTIVILPGDKLSELKDYSYKIKESKIELYTHKCCTLM